MKCLKKNSVLANNNCCFAKSFFCTCLVTILQFWEKIVKNEELLRFSQLKKDCDLIIRFGALFWKAYNLSNTFDTSHATVGCLKRKIRPLFLKSLSKNFQLSFLSNYEFFSGLSDSENQKRAITYVCAIKNELVCCTIMEVSLTGYQHPKYYFKQKFWTIEVFQKISQSSQTSIVDMQKAFFLHSFGDYITILRDNREKWRRSSFFVIKKWLLPY